MAVKLAEAAVRIRAVGVDEARAKILKLDGTLKSALRAPAGAERALAPLRQRIDLLATAAQQEATKAQALRKLEGVEAGVARALDRSNLSLAQRVKLEGLLKSAQAARAAATPPAPPPPPPLPPAAFGRADTAAMQRRVAALAEGVKLEATRAESLRKLAGVEAGLSTTLQRNNLTLQQRIALEGQLARVQAIRASVAPKVALASFGAADNTVLSRRIALLAEGMKLEGTRAASLGKLAGVEAGLTRALARTNLTLEQRVRLEAQLTRVRALRAPEPVAAPVPTPGLGLGGMTRGLVAGFGVTLGLSAVARGLGAIGAASDRAETAQRKLAASAKITGESLATITGFARGAADGLELTESVAADLTQATVKLTSRAGELNKSGLFMVRWMDLAASQGMTTEESLQALTTTLIGQDEGLNRLGLSNPQQIYERWGRAAGVSAAKMTEAQKAQAIINEILTVGAKVQGEHERRMQSAAGASDRLAKAQEELAIAMGTATRGMRIGFLEGTTALVGFLAKHTDLVVAIGAAVASGGAFSLLLSSIKAINAAMAVSSATAIPGFLGGLVKIGTWAKSPQGLAVLAIATAIGGLTYLMKRGKRDADAFTAALEQSVSAMDAEQAKAALAAKERALADTRKALLGTTNAPGMSGAEREANNARNAQLTKQKELIEQQIAALKRRIEVAKSEPTPPPPPPDGDTPKHTLDAEIKALEELRELRPLTAAEAARAAAIERTLTAQRDALATQTGKSADATIKLAEAEERLARVRGILPANEMGNALAGRTAPAPQMIDPARAPVDTRPPLPALPPLGRPESPAEAASRESRARFAAIRELLQKELGDLADEAEQMALGIGNAIAGGLAAGITAAIANGSLSEGFAALAGTLLGGLGGAMVQFGTAALAASTLMEAIMKSLASLLPGGAVVASLAMIALGATLQGLGGAAQKAFSGGGGRGGGMGSAPAAFADSTVRIPLGRPIRPGTLAQPSVPALPAAGSVAAAPQPITHHWTVIGKNDPVAQRSIVRLVNNAHRRNIRG